MNSLDKRALTITLRIRFLSGWVAIDNLPCVAAVLEGARSHHTHTVVRWAGSVVTGQPRGKTRLRYQNRDRKVSSTRVATSQLEPDPRAIQG